MATSTLTNGSEIVNGDIGNEIDESEDDVDCTVNDGVIDKSKNGVTPQDVDRFGFFGGSQYTNPER